MSQTDKAAYYKALKAAGVQFDKHYREYNTEELQQAYTKLREAGAIADPPPAPPKPAAVPIRPTAANPAEMPGQRLNTREEWEVIRVDEQGRQWLQEEVLKKGYAAPRGRRVLTYTETGAETQTVQNGEYSESFEVAGQGSGRPAQVKITLPSYQAGIYVDPRYKMFRVHCYNGNEGFNLFDVQDYYGGKELVPATISRKYVENVLCYDIRTTIMAIQAEYRHLQLTGKV